MRRAAPHALAAWMLAGLAAAPAAALPPVGAKVTAVRVVDLSGAARPLPDPRRAVIVMYEDKDAGAQNRHARVSIGAFTDNRQNREKVDFLPIADVERWDFWPARGYVIADVREASRAATYPVYLDWKGAVRRAWGLTAGKSGVLLVAADGTLLFAAEGPLSPRALREIADRLLELGARPVDPPRR